VNIQRKVIVIDYKLGNIFSIVQACKNVGLNPEVSSDKDTILKAEAIILPGVGAFGDAMENLRKLDIISPLKDYVSSGRPLMGICLGMQLLFTESEEFGSNKGLGLINGNIKKFSNHIGNEIIKVPQIGWNTIYSSVITSSWENCPLRGLDVKTFMYFVHSFYAIPATNEDVLALTNYAGIEYCSAVKKRNIFATQFHPEKSAENGLLIYKNWATQINNYYNDEA
jgi:glutamine amidotransferase